MDMKRIIDREQELLNHASELGLNSILIDGIKLILEKLKDGKSLSYSEYQLLEVLQEIMEYDS
jgi:hypothetical protein